MRRAESQVLVLVTGPDTTSAGGAGIQHHVKYLLRAFEDVEGVDLMPFAITSVVIDEPWVVKGVRLLWKYAVFALTAPKADVVHVNSTIDTRSIIRDCGVIAISRVLGRPVLLQFHGGAVDRLSWSGSGLARGLAGALLRKATRVVFLTESQACSMREAFGLERTGLVANYVDAPVAAPVRGRHPGLRVLFVGRLEAEKGLREAIEGFRQARGEGWEMRVAGDGPLASEVACAAAATPGLEAVGFAQEEARDELYAWADVLVSPSYREALPYVLLEAAAAGTALVAVDVGAVASVVRDGVNGFLLDRPDAERVAECLRRLGEDPDMLARMCERGGELVRDEFSFASMRERFGALYSALARREPGA